MQILSFAVLAAAASIVSAQAAAPVAPVSITSPLTGTVYVAGKQAIISWVSPNADSIPQIVLAQGASTALQPVTTIATNVSTASGTYTWDIPATLPPATNYAFELGASPNIAFTGLFEIKGPNGETGTNSSASALPGAAATPAASGAPAMASKPAGSTGSSSSSGNSGTSGSSNAASGASQASTSTTSKSDASKLAASGMMVAFGVASYLFL